VEIHFHLGANVVLSSGIRIGLPISEAMARDVRPSRIRPAGAQSHAYEFNSRGLIRGVDGRSGNVTQIILAVGR